MVVKVSILFFVVVVWLDVIFFAKLEFFYEFICFDERRNELTLGFIGTYFFSINAELDKCAELLGCNFFHFILLHGESGLGAIF